MKQKTVLTEKNMFSKVGHTSWEGMEVTGMPVFTIVRGQVVMENGKILGKAGCGQFQPGSAFEK